MDMTITQNAIAPATAQTQSTVSNATSQASTPAPVSNSSPTDSITLSPDAVQALASPASPTTASGLSDSTGTAATGSVALPGWNSDQITDALTALNDVSGKTSVADQISGYELLMSKIADAASFDPADPDNKNAVDTATAFATSAFMQHVQSLTDQMNAITTQPGISASEAQQRKLDGFNALSSDDQQIVVASLNTTAVTTGRTAQWTSVDSFQAGMKATIDVDRAVEAAYANPTYAAGMSANMPTENVDANTAKFMALQKQATAAGDSATVDLLSLSRSGLTGDAFTAAANSYFAKYGPPPAQTAEQQTEESAAPPAPKTTILEANHLRSQFTAIATLNDSSGQSSLSDKMSAYQQIGSSFGSQQDGLSHMAIAMAWTHSSFTNTVTQVSDQYEQQSWAGHGGTEVSAVHAQIDAFNALSTEGQQIVAGLSGASGQDATPAGYLSKLTDGLANAAEGDAINTAGHSGNVALYHQLIEAMYERLGMGNPDAGTAFDQSTASQSAKIPAAGNASPFTATISAGVDEKTNLARAALQLFNQAPIKKPDTKTGLEALIESFQSAGSRSSTFLLSPKPVNTSGNEINQSA